MGVQAPTLHLRTHGPASSSWGTPPPPTPTLQRLCPVMRAARTFHSGQQDFMENYRLSRAPKNFLKYFYCPDPLFKKKRMFTRGN